MVCVCCVLVRRYKITGTLDPVRNLTGLTYLDVSTNALIGEFIQTLVLRMWVCALVQ
jgi:hypothetical protein